MNSSRVRIDCHAFYTRIQGISEIVEGISTCIPKYDCAGLTTLLVFQAWASK